MNKRLLAGVLVVLGFLLVVLTAGLSLAQGAVPSAGSDPAGAILPAAGVGEQELAPEAAPAAGLVEPAGSAQGSNPHGPATHRAAEPAGPEELEPGADPAAESPVDSQSSDPLSPSR